MFETVDYYDSTGEKIRTYLEQPLELAPLASFEVVVPTDDQTGGGAPTLLWPGALRML